jgi:hypothetical protein
MVSVTLLLRGVLLIGAGSHVYFGRLMIIYEQ